MYIFKRKTHTNKFYKTISLYYARKQSKNIGRVSDLSPVYESICHLRQAMEINEALFKSCHRMINGRVYFKNRMTLLKMNPSISYPSIAVGYQRVTSNFWCRTAIYRIWCNNLTQITLHRYLNICLNCQTT